MNQQSSKNIIWNSTKAIHFHIRYFFKEVENKYLQQNQYKHYLILDQNICSVWNKKNISIKDHTDHTDWHKINSVT